MTESQSVVEGELVGICRSVLRVESVDAGRSFTDNGGDSFSTLVFVAEVLRQFSNAVTAETVLTSTSLAALADTIVTRRTGPSRMACTGFSTW